MRIAIVGAGAAGLAAAIFAARRGPGAEIVLFDGAARPGAKILISGGSRCNVTNAAVGERDFEGSPRALIRRVLRAFGSADTVRFFAELGVRLHEEEDGKLFPDANRSRVVLDALLRETQRLGVVFASGRRVVGLSGSAGRFRLQTPVGPHEADVVLLATGGLSLPKTGSDGVGMRLAEGLGHSVVPTTPALVPLFLGGSLHRRLSGVSQPAEITVRIAGRAVAKRRGSMLWTHFGVSGPVVLDVSRTWLRAHAEGQAPALTANLAGGLGFDEAERAWLALARESPRLSLARALTRWLPAAVADASIEELGLDGRTALGRLRREDRRACLRAVLERELPVVGSQGYSFAEATAGGVPLAELNPATMGSRRCPGLFLAGEMLDVDGRVGGFNFQWAWSSAWVAARGMLERSQDLC